MKEAIEDGESRDRARSGRKRRRCGERGCDPAARSRAASRIASVAPSGRAPWRRLGASSGARADKARPWAAPDSAVLRQALRQARPDRWCKGPWPLRRDAGSLGFPRGPRTVAPAGPDAETAFQRRHLRPRTRSVQKSGPANRQIRRRLHPGAMRMRSTRNRADPGGEWQRKVVAIARANGRARQIRASRAPARGNIRCGPRTSARRAEADFSAP